MILLGSTIGWSNYPQFTINGVNKMLPRPVCSCCGKGEGRSLMNSVWFKELSLQAYISSCNYLQHMIPRNNCYKNVLRTLISCQKIIPVSILIHDTWFISVSEITLLNKLIYY